MDKYTRKCTDEQTWKAYKLGAPIVHTTSYVDLCGLIRKSVNMETNERTWMIQPTVEQMIGWLDEQGYEVEVCRLTKGGNWAVFVQEVQEVGCYYTSRYSAELSGINFALTLMIADRARKQKISEDCVHCGDCDDERPLDMVSNE